MATEENPYAGQGPVLLDIGGDVGALIVTMPAETEDLEVEIRPAGATAAKLAQAPSGTPTTPQDGPDDGDPHSSEHDHAHDDAQSHGHGHGHNHAASPFPHVGVVGRSVEGGVSFTLVYPSVQAGDYELCPIPGDEIAMTATVVGGEVSEATWPADTAGATA